MPFTFHWNEGFVPPLENVDVNVTGVPSQTLLAEVVMEMITGPPEPTKMFFWVGVTGEHPLVSVYPTRTHCSPVVFHMIVAEVSEFNPPATRMPSGE